MTYMIALSIQQPWAWLIMAGYKDIENRTWRPPVHVIGQRIGIHASRTFDLQGYRRIRLVFPEIPMPAVAAADRWADVFESGGLIGSAILRECVTVSESPWFEGPFGLVFGEPMTHRFRRCKGQLGFFQPVVVEGRP